MAQNPEPQACKQGQENKAEIGKVKTTVRIFGAIFFTVVGASFVYATVLYRSGCGADQETRAAIIQLRGECDQEKEKRHEIEVRAAKVDTHMAAQTELMRRIDLHLRSR